MRTISRRVLREHWEKFGRSDSEQPLRTWFNVCRKAHWANFDAVKREFGARVDVADGKYVFDIKGNDYRLICVIDFVRHGILVLWVGTHGEYDQLCKNGGAGLKRL